MRDQLRFAIVVPTLNAGTNWGHWIATVQQQTFRPWKVLVLDSASTDSTVPLAKQAGFDVCHIERKCFNHGGTRQFGLELLGDEIELIFYLTQDAILSDPHSIERLALAFSDVRVGAAYGRQLASSGASPLAIHARKFNYPSKSNVASLADRAALGIKACFLSNSFSAYRVSDLRSAGGFPADVILGEDMSVAAKLLMAGKQISYIADACVYHSHNYSLAEEFRRYFDTGVFHARSRWLLEAFGSAGGEGLRFVHSEMKFLLRNAPLWIPTALLRTLAKWMGYRLGRLETYFPLWFKRRCSMYRGYWR